MPDIREVLEALSPEDRLSWQKHRTALRRAWLHAHSDILGIDKWDTHDDAVLDLLDIRLITLFDQSGKLTTTKDIAGDEGTIVADTIEGKPVVSETNKLPTNGWTTK